ncbi:HET-domain-containing protein [Zopfia rhizophila CBS 207.26]|uniref:HET-domain-containing protein n=1 Tax=Zopfia rhizophila CBS 207.26 TaxID=1314779 RepID=A0A6A6EIB8_9PEZI|nr:HET-domain-containing protein [Zopfia rhizophila CBS 207.26]
MCLPQNVRLILVKTSRSAFQYYPKLKVPHVLRYFAHGFDGVTSPTIATIMTPNPRQHCRLDSSTFSELPRTFRDAVQVTRELGIQYLWIDSLCIIQWNQEDWKHEATRMEGVFASAYCTIAATSAVDSEAGFLKRNVSSECVLAQDASGRRLYICADTDDSNNHVDIDDFDDHVEKAPLNTRAWVMQERALSRRTIHFSGKQMYWECGEGVYCETLTRLQSSLRKKFFMLDSNFPDRLLKSGNRRTIEFIHSVFEDYSKRGLTIGTDRRVAISGLEARIAHARGCESRYGIFEQYLHRNLLWQRSEERTKPIEYGTWTVPSWSWMAYNGGIEFMDIPFGDVDWIDKLRFDKECELALIADVGMFLDCTVQPDGNQYAVLDFGGMKRGWIHYDVEESKNLRKIECVVAGKKSNKDVKEYYILVVRPTKVDGKYRRVGVGLIQSDYVVRQRLNVRVL